MKINLIYIFIVGCCLEYSDGDGHEKHVKVSLPKLVHKHKHQVVVHEKSSGKKHIVIHKHEHKHHHKHDHGHKHGHKHEGKHVHKHSGKHSHKHEGKHTHKHQGKHSHKHEGKHSHKHEGKHSHKHSGKASHTHKHNHKLSGKHEHSHKHSGKYSHNHKHSGKFSSGGKSHDDHEKLVFDIDNNQHAEFIHEPVGPHSEYIYAPYQIEASDYEEYQQPNEEQVAEDDEDHDNIENYDEFDSPSGNIENYDDSDLDFLSAKKPPANLDYGYNKAIIGELVKKVYSEHEPAVAYASNNVIKKVTPDSFNFEDDAEEVLVKPRRKLRNKKYHNIKDDKIGVIQKPGQTPWVPMKNTNDPSISASTTVEQKIPPNFIMNKIDPRLHHSGSTDNKKIKIHVGDLSASTLKPYGVITASSFSSTTRSLRQREDESDPMKVEEFHSTRLFPKTTSKPARN